MLAAAGASTEGIDYFLFHQANRMINETIRKKLKLPVEKVPSTLLDFGNTSSASIPLTMTMHTRQRLANSSAKLLLSGFGVGLSWASCVLDVANAVMPDLVEI